MPTLPSGLPSEVADDEDLARFLTSRSQFNSIIVKPSAFMPSPQSGESSVSRHGAEPNSKLWELGLAAAGERTLYGAGILKAGAVRKARLTIESSEPPDLHAAIRAWPVVHEDPQMEIALRKERAAELSSSCGEPVRYLNGEI